MLETVSTRHHCSSDEGVIIGASIGVAVTFVSAIGLAIRDARAGVSGGDMPGMLPEFIHDKLPEMLQEANLEAKKMWDKYGPPTLHLVNYMLGILAIASTALLGVDQQSWNGVSTAMFTLILSSGPMFSLMLQMFEGVRTMPCNCCVWPIYIPGFLVAILFNFTWAIFLPLLAELKIVLQRYFAEPGDSAWQLFQQRVNLEEVLMLFPKTAALFFLYHGCHMPLALFIAYLLIMLFGLWCLAYDKVFTFLHKREDFFWVVKSGGLITESKLQLSIHSAMMFLFWGMTLGAISISVRTGEGQIPVAYTTISSVIAASALATEIVFAYFGWCTRQPEPKPADVNEPMMDGSQI